MTARRVAVHCMAIHRVAIHRISVRRMAIHHMAIHRVAIHRAWPAAGRTAGRTADRLHRVGIGSKWDSMTRRLARVQVSQRCWRVPWAMVQVQVGGVPSAVVPHWAHTALPVVNSACSYVFWFISRQYPRHCRERGHNASEAAQLDSP
ncbi:hypothetical protein A6A06_02790 [Streptomyces sp. CB02923]|nr:hypothetical protein A6A06_02790 [Streptomyces sp. CB02923]